HQPEQMRESLFVRGVLAFGELAGAFLKLFRHFLGLVCWTAQIDQNRGQFFGCHSIVPQEASAMRKRLSHGVGGSLHLIGRNYLNAFYALSRNRLALFAPAA